MPVSSQSVHWQCKDVVPTLRGPCADVLCANGVSSAHFEPIFRGCCAEYPLNVCRRYADVVRTFRSGIGTSQHLKSRGKRFFHRILEKNRYFLILYHMTTRDSNIVTSMVVSTAHCIPSYLIRTIFLQDCNISTSSLHKKKVFWSGTVLSRIFCNNSFPRNCGWLHGKWELQPPRSGHSHKGYHSVVHEATQ